MVTILIGLVKHHNRVLFTATVEDQNFALFNYVNELNGEIEMVLKQIEQVNNTLQFL